MDERLIVYLSADATNLFFGLGRAEARLLAFAGYAAATLTRMAVELGASYEKNLVAFQALARVQGDEYSGLMSVAMNQLDMLAKEQQASFKEVKNLAGGANEVAGGFSKAAAESKAMMDALGTGKKATMDFNFKEYTTGADEAQAKGKELLDNIQQLAVATPYQTEELVRSARMLAGYGIAIDDIIPSLHAIGEVTAGVGGDTEKLMRITLAYGQVVSKGRFYATELRQFAEAGVGVKDFADTMGVSVKHFQELMERGQVGSDIIVKAFMRMTSEGGKFEGLMDKIMKTPAGRWNEFRESALITLQKIGVEALKGLEKGGFWKELERIGDEFKEIGPQIGEALATGFGHARDVLIGVQEIVDGIGVTIRHIDDTWLFRQIKGGTGLNFTLGKELSALLMGEDRETVNQRVGRTDMKDVEAMFVAIPSVIDSIVVMFKLIPETIEGMAGHLAIAAVYGQKAIKAFFEALIQAVVGGINSMIEEWNKVNPFAKVGLPLKTIPSPFGDMDFQKAFSHEFLMSQVEETDLAKGAREMIKKANASAVPKQQQLMEAWRPVREFYDKVLGTGEMEDAKAIERQLADIKKQKDALAEGQVKLLPADMEDFLRGINGELAKTGFHGSKLGLDEFHRKIDAIKTGLDPMGYGWAQVFRKMKDDVDGVTSSLIRLKTVTPDEAGALREVVEISGLGLGLGTGKAPQQVEGPFADFMGPVSDYDRRRMAGAINAGQIMRETALALSEIAAGANALRDHRNLQSSVEKVQSSVKSYFSFLIKGMNNVDFVMSDGTMGVEAISKKLQAMTADQRMDEIGKMTLRSKLISPEAAAFGARQLFETLRNSVKDRLEVRYPTPMFQGSQDAIDTINRWRSGVGTSDPIDQVRQVLQLVADATEQEKQYSAKILAALETIQKERLVVTVKKPGEP